MSNQNKVLIVSSWGYAPAWYKYEYTVNLFSPAFSKFAKFLRDFKCSSCCSTLVLGSALKNIGFECETIVFGLDTVANPSEALSENKNLRKLAEEKYEKWLSVLIEKCSCCKENQKHITVKVTPGVGKFHGWEYKGCVDHLFNIAFFTLLEKFENMKYNWVFLDITHGINFQTLAILYAVMACLTLFEMENKLIIVNSEPPSPSGMKCIKETSKSYQTINQLAILDVTRLKEALSFIKMLTSLKRLETSTIKKALKDLKRTYGSSSSLVRKLEDKVIPFFSLLKCGAIALTYKESYIEVDRGKRRILSFWDNIDELTKISLPNNFPYMPEVDEKNRCIIYPQANIYDALDNAVNLVIRDFYGRITEKHGPENLLSYMRNLIGIYGELGDRFAELIVKKSYGELNDILKYLNNADENTVPVYTYRILLLNVHKIRAYTQKTKRSLELSINEIEKIIKRQLEEKTKIVEAKSIPEEYLRNIVAHAGLGFPILIEFKIHKGSIKEVIFDKVTLRVIEKLIA